jgi:hypothetical protein
MFFAFLVLPHGSYFCPARNLPIEAGNGQSSRCLLFGSPAGSATAPPTHSPAPGGWRPVRIRLSPGQVASHSQAARERGHRTLRPCCFIGGYLPKPPSPRWIAYAGNASRTTQPIGLCLHHPRKRFVKYKRDTNELAPLLSFY